MLADAWLVRCTSAAEKQQNSPAYPLGFAECGTSREMYRLSSFRSARPLALASFVLRIQVESIYRIEPPRSARIAMRTTRKRRGLGRRQVVKENSTGIRQRGGGRSIALGLRHLISERAPVTFVEPPSSGRHVQRVALEPNKMRGCVPFRISRPALRRRPGERRTIYSLVTASGNEIDGAPNCPHAVSYLLQSTAGGDASARSSVARSG